MGDGNSLLNSVTNSNHSCSFRKPGFLIFSLLFLLYSLFYTNDSFTHHSMDTLYRKCSNVHSKRIQVHDTMKSFLYLMSKLRGITFYVNEKLVSANKEKKSVKCAGKGLIAESGVDWVRKNILKISQYQPSVFFKMGV